MKQIGKWNAYELLWLGLFCAVAIGITIATKDSFFGFTVFLTGVLCVVLTAKGNIISYIFGMYNTFGYAWLAYQNGLFGEVALNLLFFVPMNIVGFIMWKKHLDEGVVEMKRMNLKGVFITGVICVIGIIALGYGLSLIQGQNSPFIDATTNLLSIVATILMVKRYREQWMVYIALNIFTIIMWGIRTVAGSPDGIIMVVMWSAYLINAFYGLYTWSKGASKQSEEVAA